MNENGLKLKMYRRYVDDVNVIVNAPKSSTKFVESERKVVQDESAAEKERDINVDDRCMTLVVNSPIKLDIDYPSRHEDGKQPILDLKVWVEMRKQEPNEVCMFYMSFIPRMWPRNA